jgi:hypothetical protein
MTSQKYLADKYAVKYDLKRAFQINILPAFIMLIFSLSCFVFDTINEFNSLGNLDSSAVKQSINENILCMLTGDSTGFMYVFYFIVFGLIFAFRNITYMHKKNINFHFSLPVDRATLFKNRTIAVLSLMASVLFVTIAGDAIINMHYLNNDLYIIKMALALFAESLLYCYVSYIIFSIGFYACYTSVEGLFFGGSILMLPTFVVFSIHCLCSSFLNGYARSNFLYYIMTDTGSNIRETSLLNITSIFNPILFGKALGSDSLNDTIISLCYRGNDYYSVMDLLSGETDSSILTGEKLKYTLPSINYILPMIIWAVVFVALVFVARYVFVHKKAENTSIHASNKVATLIFTLEAGICFSALVISIFDLVWTINNIYLAVLIMVLIFVAVFFIFNAICTRKVILHKKTYITAGIVSICLVIVAGVLGLGGFGYTNYVPDVDDIEMATITGSGIATLNHNEEGDSSYFSTLPFMSDDEFGFAIFTDKEDIQKLCDVNKSLVAKSKDKVNANVTVAYKLKNGKKVCRNYTVADKDAVYNVLSLTDTDTYKDYLEYLLLSDSYDYNDEFYSNLDEFGLDYTYFNSDYDLTTIKNSLYINGAVSVSHYGTDDETKIDNTEELRQALFDDLSQSTFEDRYNSDEQEIAELVFTENLDPDIYDGISCTYRIYPSMTNTINYLKSVNAYSESTDYFGNKPTKAYYATVEELKKSSDFIDSNMFSSNYTSESDYTDLYSDSIETIYTGGVITDSDQIDTLLQLGKLYKYCDNDDVVVLFEIKDEDDEISYQPLAIDKTDIPNFLK